MQFNVKGLRTIKHHNSNQIMQNVNLLSARLWMAPTYENTTPKKTQICQI